MREFASLRQASVALFCIVVAIQLNAQPFAEGGFIPSGVNIRDIVDIAISDEEAQHPWLHGVELTLDPTKPITRDAFEAWYRGQVELSSGSQLRAIELPRKKSANFEIVRLQHHYRDLRVIGEEVVVVERDGFVTSALARITPNISLDIDSAYPESRVITIATNVVAENLADHVTDGAEVEFEATPTCELAVGRRSYSTPVRAELQYLCAVRTKRPTDTWSVVLDGLSGDLIKASSTAKYLWSPSTGSGLTTVPSVGAVSFPAEKHSASNTHRLAAPEVLTLDAENTTNDIDPLNYVTSSSDLFGAGLEAGVTAHWAGLESIKAFQNRLGADFLLLLEARTGDQQIQNIVNWNVNKTFIYPDRATAYFGQNPSIQSHDKIAIDVVGHEYAHALAWYSLPPFPYDPAGTQYDSLHESYADILGEVVEVELAIYAGHTWVTGNEMPPGNKIRNHRNPVQSVPQQPDVYGVPPWMIPGTQNYDPHINASIMNLWMNLMVEGCDGCSNSLMVPFTVDKIGLDGALNILDTSFMSLPFLSTYPTARTMTQVVARNFCGDFSREWRATHNAWFAVGLNNYQITGDEHLVPAGGAVDVVPWNAELKWQAEQYTLETEWQLQVSEDPAFPQADLINIVTSTLATDANLQVGVAQPLLSADKTYYWRVRPTDADATMECWRPTRSFTTDDQIPIPFFPTSGVVHPWAIDFSYSAVEGATHYEIQISEQQVFPTDENDHSTLIFPPQIFEADPNEPDQTARITVPKNMEALHWRVSARHKPDQGEEIVGGWSSVETFGTNTPAVVLTQPVDQLPDYPWPIHFQWEPLAGAEFRLTSEIVNGAHDEPSMDWSTNSWLLWFQDAKDLFTAENDGFLWQVFGKGPPFGSEQTPEAESTREDADPSPQWTVYVDGDPTQPSVNVDPAGGCISHGTELTATWPDIVNRTHYDVVVNGVDISPMFSTSIIYPAEPAWNVDSASVKVTAKSSQLLGVAPTVETTSVQATKPTITFVGTSAEVVPVEWTIEYPGTNEFRIETFEELNCQGSMKSQADVHVSPENAAGTHFKGQFNDFGKKKRPKSFHVRANHPICTGPFSDCATFSHAEPEPPQPNFPPIQCGDAVVAGGIQGGNFVLDFGQMVSGSVTLDYDHYCVPDWTIIRMPDNTVVIDTDCEGTGVPSNDDLIPACTHGFENESGSFNNASFLKINVQPNCQGFPDTWWEIQVSCNVSPSSP